MKIQPTLAKVKEIESTDRYNVLPVSLEILSDFTTPIETMKILKNVSTHCYMPESAQANETWGATRFSDMTRNLGKTGKRRAAYVPSRRNKTQRKDR